MRSSLTISDRTLRRVGRTLSILALATIPVTLLMLTMARALGNMFANYTFLNMLIALCYGALGLLLINSQPRNRLVWFFIILGCSLGIVGIVDGSAELTARSQGVGYEDIDLSGWPPGLARLAGAVHSTWLVANIGLPTFGLLLAPDGRLLSRRWRPVAAITALPLALGCGLYASKWPLLGGNAVDAFSDWQELAFSLGFSVLIVSIMSSLTSIVLRYRRSDTGTRRRLRWLMVGSGLLVFLWFFEILGPNVTGDRGSDVVLVAVYPILAMSFGLAIWRDQLFDVDVVISKSVMYLGLLAAISAVYAAVVVGPLLVLGVSDGEQEPGLLLPIVATGVVALLFEPIRSRMQRGANRLVYGKRSTPHEVLSQVTSRLAESSTTSTDELARLVAEGTGAEHVVVSLVTESGLLPTGSWSSTEAPAPPTSVSDEFSAAVDVFHESERLGMVTISKPRSDPITPADRELLDDVAAGAGLSLRNIRLNRDLESRAADVRDSRRRLIEAQDRERHRLERDLHDGAQQQVVALKVKLGIAKTVAEREGADAIATGIVALADDTQDAVDALRRVAHGIYPPLLESEGLETALRAVERSSAIPVELDVVELDRYGRSTEATAYFCVTETLERARMSGATSAHVELAGRNGDLVARIDLGPVETELDLRPVADRLDAGGGSITIERQLDRGLCIVGSLPASMDEGLAAPSLAAQQPSQAT